MKLSLIEGIAIGIGGMVGGGIFLLNGVSVYKNRGYAPISWLIGMSICILIAFSYCILSDEYPSKGGTIDYPKELMSKGEGEKTVFSMVVILGYIVLTTVYSLALANYLAQYFNVPKFASIFAIFIIIFCQVINYFPQEVFSKILNILVYGKFLIFLALIVIGFIIKGKSSNTVGGSSGKSGSILNTITAFSIFLFGINSFLSYEGFEMISNLSADMEERRVNIPLSFMASIIAVGVVYAGISFVTNKHIGGSITKKNMFSSLNNLVAQYGFGSAGKIIIIILCAMANISAINATLFTNINIWDNFISNNEKQGYAPSVSKLLKKDVPLPLFKEKRKLYLWVGNLISCVLMFLPQLVVTNLGSLSFLTIFAVISYMAILLIHKKDKDKKDIHFFGKPFPKSVGKFISYSGLTACIVGVLLLVIDIIKQLY